MNVATDMRDPYQALGVNSSASPDEIKKAYRRLAKEFHPDRNPGDKAKESRFKEISAAYNILSDPEKRSEYDTMQQGGGIPAGMDLSELFAQMFGGGRGAGGGTRVRYTTSSGGNPFGGVGGGSPFGGMGGMGGSPFGGMGGMGGSPFGGMGGGQRQARRPQQPKKPAPPKERKVRAADGSELILKGSNYYSDLRISFEKAMLGTVATIPTRTGKAKMKIPPGTSSGMKLRLKGKGEPKSGKGAERGDHFVTIHIDVPKVASEEAQKALAKLLESLSKD